MATSFDEINQKLLANKPDLAAAILEHEVSIRRFNTDPPRFELRWAKVGVNKPISFDNVKDLWSFTTVQRTIFERWKVVIEDIKSKDWHDLLIILTDHIEEIDAPGASLAALVLDILEHWIERFNSVEWSAGDLNTRPIFKNGFYYFKVTAFETHALFAQGSRFFYQRYAIPRPTLYKILADAGAKSTTQKYKGKTIRLWQIPEDFNKPKEAPQGDLDRNEDEDIAESDETNGENKLEIAEKYVPDDF